MNNNQWYKDKVFYQIWPRSFKDENEHWKVPAGYDMENAQLCLCNYENVKDFRLRPYEARVYLWGKIGSAKNEA